MKNAKQSSTFSLSHRNGGRLVDHHHVLVHVDDADLLGAHGNLVPGTERRKKEEGDMKAELASQMLPRRKKCTIFLKKLYVTNSKLEGSCLYNYVGTMYICFNVP